MNGVTRTGSDPLDDLVDVIDSGGAARWAAVATLAGSPDPRAYGRLATCATGRAHDDART